jgi:glycosyltransferase involved in cell wall biosynthesis
MKILIVNTYDFGGAASACKRLHIGLIEIGFDSTLLFKERKKPLKNSLVYPKKLINYRKRIINKFRIVSGKCNFASSIPKSEYHKSQFLKQRPDGLEYFSFINSNCDITATKAYKEADLIHLHWVADFLDWKSFFNRNTKPIVWTLHDQNPFLGGEHYAERYLGIDYFGNPIPRVRKQVELMIEQKLLMRKKIYLNLLTNITIVSPSRWLMNSSKVSELFNGFPHFLIPYGIPTNIYKPLDRNYCREVLGLPTNKQIILFVAESVDNSRKGYAFLQRSLELIDEKFSKNIILCAIGEKVEMNQNNTVIELGKFNDERLMAIAYSAADIFVLPSLEDNLPNTILESLCCGTPVICFPVGGIIDVVEDGENGLICDEISVLGLLNRITKFLSGELKFDRESISNNAIMQFSLHNQANEYIKLYKNILDCK